MAVSAEPVACLFADNGCEQGAILGAYYNGTENAPSQPAHIDYHRYEDGTELWYDRESHKLVAKVNGDCELECEKSLKARCKEEAEIHSEARLTLKAPVINILGVLNMANYEGEPTTGTLKGNFKKPSKAKNILRRFLIALAIDSHFPCKLTYDLPRLFI